MKLLKIINASITKQQALEILDQHNLKASFYRVPQGEDQELSEAMRLLIGLGYLIQHRSDNRLVGALVNATSVSACDSSKQGDFVEPNIIRRVFDKQSPVTDPKKQQ